MQKLEGSGADLKSFTYPDGLELKLPGRWFNLDNIWNPVKVNDKLMNMITRLGDFHAQGITLSHPIILFIVSWSLLPTLPLLPLLPISKTVIGGFYNLWMPKVTCGKSGKADINLAVPIFKVAIFYSLTPYSMSCNWRSSAFTDIWISRTDRARERMSRISAMAKVISAAVEKWT